MRTPAWHDSVLAVPDIVRILQGSQNTANVFLEFAAQIVIATPEAKEKGSTSTEHVMESL